MDLFVENLTNVDFSYLHPERGLVGETWLASIVLNGALDEQGMVCDFGIVKKTLRQWLDDTIDHCLLVPTLAAGVNIDEQQDQVSVNWRLKKNSIQCTSPRQAFALIDSAEITPDTVAQWCIQQLAALLPDSIQRIELSFKPEAISHHAYHYSHGLKKHRGNCQRIAHGHRSTLEIYINNERNHGLEQQWCQRWQDIYIGTEEDLVEKTPDQQLIFKYQAQQGDFLLSMPAQHCYLMNTDTTVEFIAQHIATQLKQKLPSSPIKVRAFEGIGKGAIATA